MQHTACFTFLMKKLFCWPWLPLILTVSITNQTEIIPAMWFQLIASVKVIWLISSTRTGAAIEDDNYKLKTNDSLSWESGRRPVYRKTGRPSGLQNSDFFCYFQFVISSPGRIEKDPVKPDTYFGCSGAPKLTPLANFAVPLYRGECAPCATNQHNLPETEGY